MKFISIFFTLGVFFNISAVAAADSDFSIALYNVQSVDWLNNTDARFAWEQSSVQALVAAKPHSSGEAIAKARALMAVLASSEILYKNSPGQMSNESTVNRKVLHGIAWSGLIDLCWSEFAAAAQLEVVSALPETSRHMTKFMNLVSSFNPTSQTVREKISTFLHSVADDISVGCRSSLATP
jgi:hypothetical protein